MIDIKGTLQGIFTKENLYTLIALVILSVAVKFVYPQIKEYLKFAGKYSAIVGILIIGLALAIILRIILKERVEKINIGAVTVILAGYIVIQTILDEFAGIILYVSET